MGYNGCGGDCVLGRDGLGRFTRDPNVLDLVEGCVWRRAAVRGGWKYFTLAVDDLEKIFATKFDCSKLYRVEYEVGGHVIECVQRFRQKYVEVHVPKDFAEEFEAGKMYKICPRRFTEVGFRTRRRELQKKDVGKDYFAKIILPKGDSGKARIEVPKTLQEHYNIRGEKVVRIALETSKDRFNVYTRTGYRPLTVTVPKKYALEKYVKVIEIKEYTLEDFIKEYNEHTMIKCAKIKQENSTLKLEIGEHEIEAKKYCFTTYGGKPYLEIEYGNKEHNVKYRVIKEENVFKLYRVTGTGYEQITNIIAGKNKIVFIAKHGKKEKRYIFHKKEGLESTLLGDPELSTEEIDNDLLRAIVVFPKEDLDKIITGLVEYGKERCYAKGALGERVAERTLRKLNYQIIGAHNGSSKHPGDDITVLKNSKVAYVEVKYVTNKSNVNYKIMQALKELHTRHLNENGTLIAAIVTYLGETKFEITLKFQAHSSSPKFFYILLNITET
ncbi:MAG: hypothetical protein H5T50_05580 [Nitrososphaeria archaeon]|nr:hypothetical protein [Nitrososphaeria archaeon]